MSDQDKKYIFFVILHVAIGVAVFLEPAISKLYGLLIVPIGMYFVLINKNRNNEVLLVAAYLVGSEVFLRMTGGNLIYEFAKYSIILFVIVGMTYDGLSKNAVAYWIYLLLLLPGVVIATQALDHDTEIRKTISFNISGPLCLGLTALYTFGKRVTLEQLNSILLYIAMPIICCTVYLILYTPSVRDVVMGTGSNFETSGGFGPNQVATMLGLGMFIFLTRIIFASKSILISTLNFVIILAMTYRGLVTFSRGGMITGAIMFIVLTGVVYLNVSSNAKLKINYFAIVVGVLFLGIWSYSIAQTGGLIQKRYSNENTLGVEKQTMLSGREAISRTEIEFFLKNPLFGVGVAKGAELRRDETGKTILSHNEVTRMLAEHGTLGIIALCILLFTPMFLYLDNKQHIYLFCFLIFWLLTINHAAMRLAAPAYVYALSLLKVQLNEVPSVHRK